MCGVELRNDPTDLQQGRWLRLHLLDPSFRKARSLITVGAGGSHLGGLWESKYYTRF